MDTEIDMLFVISDMIVTGILDAKHVMGNIVNFEVHTPCRCTSSEKAVNNKDIEVVRVYFTVKRCRRIFVLELYRFPNGFIDVMWGVVAEGDVSIRLNQTQKNHMYMKIKNGPWESEVIEQLDIADYREFQKSYFVQPLDWEFLVRLDTLTDDDLFSCHDNNGNISKEYLDYDLLACNLCEFIDIFSRECLLDVTGGRA